MRICIDTTILLDILKDEFRASHDKFYTALARRETVIIPTVVYAELMPQFKGDTVLQDQFLKEHKIVIEPLGLDSVVAAAQAWMQYLKRKGKSICPQCGHNLNTRKHFLSDFYIGGFASATCNAILTRDRGIYTKYFPELIGYEGCLKDISA